MKIRLLLVVSVSVILASSMAHGSGSFDMVATGTLSDGNLQWDLDWLPQGGSAVTTNAVMISQGSNSVGAIEWQCIATNYWYSFFSDHCRYHCCFLDMHGTYDESSETVSGTAEGYYIVYVDEVTVDTNSPMYRYDGAGTFTGTLLSGNTFQTGVGTFNMNMTGAYYQPSPGDAIETYTIISGALTGSWNNTFLFPVDFDVIWQKYLEFAQESTTWPDGTTDQTPLYGPYGSGWKNNLYAWSLNSATRAIAERYDCAALQWKTLYFFEQLDPAYYRGWLYEAVRRDWFLPNVTEHQAVRVWMWGQDPRYEAVIFDPHAHQCPEYYAASNNIWYEMSSGWGYSSVDPPWSDWDSLRSPEGESSERAAGGAFCFGMETPGNVLIVNSSGQRLGILPGGETVSEFNPIDAYMWQSDDGNIQWAFNLPDDTYTVSTTGTNVGTWQLATGFPDAEMVHDYGTNSMAVGEEIELSWNAGSGEDVTDSDGAAYGFELQNENKPCNDYDGDGRSDLPIFDTKTGFWYVLSATNAVKVWAEPWHAMGSGSGETAVGGIAWDFTLTNHVTGFAVSLSDLAGSIVVLCFYSADGAGCDHNLAAVEQDINQYYQFHGGNPYGVPVKVVEINIGCWLDSATTDAFIQQYGLTFVLDDFNGVAWSQFYMDNLIPRFVVINGVPDSPGLQQWQVCYNEKGCTGVSGLRGVIDVIQASSGSLQPVSGDFNGDGKSDLATFDESTGYWYIRDASGTAIADAVQWGWSGAKPVSGDYNGDRKSDLAVFDSNTGYWYVLSPTGEVIFWAVQWGWPGAVPVSGDYNADGYSDMGVFDSNTGYWYVLSSWQRVISWAVQWGWPGAVPVPGDYNGDKISDMAVFDSNTGYWYVLSPSGELIAWAVQWGWPGAMPVSGDYNADGVCDYAVFDSNSGYWYVLSASGELIAWAVQWGWPGAYPPRE